jgi:hypothetical protein
MIVGIAMALLIIPAEVFAQESVMSPCTDCSALGSASSRTAPVDGLRHAAAKEGARLALALSTPSQQQQPATRQRSWMRRHPILGGTLMGASVGLFFGATVGLVNDMGLGMEQDDFGPAKGASVGAAVGAGFGALGGSIWRARHALVPFKVSPSESDERRR